jgi:hypothetical protein
MSNHSSRSILVTAMLTTDNVDDLFKMANYLQARGIYSRANSPENIAYARPPENVAFARPPLNNRPISPVQYHLNAPVSPISYHHVAPPANTQQTDSIKKAVDELPEALLSKLKSLQNDETHVHLERIANLEGILRKVTEELTETKLNAASTASEKLDSYKFQIHELNMKVSRQQLEMNSLLQQNNMLRAKNNRMVDAEVYAPKPVEWRANLALKERILGQVDESHHYKQHGMHTSNLSTINLIRTTVNQVSSANAPTVCDSLMECVSRLLTDSQSFERESSELESRMTRIVKESESVRKETSEAIAKIHKEYEVKLGNAFDERDRVEAKLRKYEMEFKEVYMEYKSISKNNQALSHDLGVLQRDNDHLSVLMSHPTPAEVIMVPDSSKDTLVAQISELSSKNHNLHVKINHLEQVIEEMRQENCDSGTKVVHAEQNAQLLESKLISAKKRVNEYKVEIECQKSKNEKAGLLITSLKEQLEQQTQTQSTPFDSLQHLDLAIQEQLLHVKQSLAAPAPVHVPAPAPEISQMHIGQFQTVIQGTND